MKVCRTLAFAIAGAAALSQSSQAAEPPFAARLETGTSFLTKDAELQRLHDAAVRVLSANVVDFTPSMKILVEGGGYPNAWLETQPMGGEMYARRDPQVAVNNQVIFLLAQRADGRLPGMVVSGATARGKGWDKNPPEGQLWMPESDLLADFGMFQGFCFPEPAWRMYHWMGRDKAYLRKLQDALVAYDTYLWRTRDSNGDGLLETWCVWDTGEDAANRFGRRWAPSRWPFEKPPGTPGLPDPQNPKDYGKYWFHPLAENQDRPTAGQMMVPFASMDIMAYSYNARATLAVIAKELDTGRESQWQAQAEDVRQRLIQHLWNQERHACFDRDRLGRPLPELIHNNLRCMWYGIFTQDMADAFIRHHLINPHAFWTPVPLVSVAIDDPLYENAPGNNWSGQPQGLTYQRAIGALERYGHFSEVTLLANKILPLLTRNGCRFAQQLDAMTGEASGQKPDGYGPMALAALEYLSRTQGIHLDVANQRVWWSVADSKASDFTSTQRWGAHRFELRVTAGKMEALAAGKTIFTCDAGTRVVTDLSGRVLELQGICPERTPLTLKADDRTASLVIRPNEIHQFSAAGFHLQYKVPFDFPR